jgi:hypothetical protein
MEFNEIYHIIYYIILYASTNLQTQDFRNSAKFSPHPEAIPNLKLLSESSRLFTAERKCLVGCRIKP